MEDTTTPIASASFDAHITRLQAAALAATRKSAVLPLDIAFHRSMDPEFAQGLDTFSERVLAVTNRLLNLVSTVDQTKSSRGKGKGKLENQDDVVDNFHSLVVDSMDQLLEKTDICLDEFLGKNKAPAIAINPPIASNSKRSMTKTSTKQSTSEPGRIEPVIHHAPHLSKPQLLFTKQPENSDAPWYPTLSHKYNAKVPLGYIYTDTETESNSGILANHPYRYEITHLTYPSRMFETCNPVAPPSLDDTEATWVSTPEDFQQMLAKLKNATEIAVDLEHHSYRSYTGFLCLLQISDRNEDWVIDLLSLRDEVEALNEVFTDPNIVKVFHGAESDVVWLQQDFNIYIVNLFDTFHASKLLEFPRHGLANLLEMYCDFVPDKRYQLADWRIRPLPEDMMKYARSDTHFLLYIYDNLRNALIDRSQSRSQSRSPRSSPPPADASSSNLKSSAGQHGLLNQELERSMETSLRVYTKEPYDVAEGSGSAGWDTLAKRWNKGALMAGGPGVGIGAMQREVYKSVHWWRERVAREEDESTRFVLQNHVLFLLAEQPPADMPALLGIFRSSVPPLVKRRMKELLSTIKDAVKRGMSMAQLDGRGTQEQKEPEPAKKDVVMLDTEMEALAEEKGDSQQQEDATAMKNFWGQNAISSATTQSSLFGSSQSTKGPVRVNFATSTSTLFGSSGNKIQAPSSSLFRKTTSASHVVHPRFEEIMAKINRSLVMSPAIPQITGASSQTPDKPHDQQQQLDGVSGMQVEIPYVAPSQRSTKQVKDEERDTIVVVGQARQKRKRNKAQQQNGTAKSNDPEADEAPMSSTLLETEEEGSNALEPESFDFSAVHNILDDNPDLEDASRKKKRQKKQNKGGVFYGDFPAPPKAHSELRSGNQSHTFK
ncbi:hypothetical protein M413DRAFT_449112 [Hebeloma cylindrosporum]|uniref:HRDC domain-containing protein n=1 Tax=Hebeloma cylindrosporum TaxID=76867 RepID=A0A0C2XF62_HEBCY|nr:hypothetical protein M413DRAFT_449112 [Hebeloma cylindrosporum h7]